MLGERVCVCAGACVYVCICECVHMRARVCVHMRVRVHVCSPCSRVGVLGRRVGRGGAKVQTSPTWIQLWGLQQAPAHFMSPDCTQGSCLRTEGVGTKT